MVIPGIVFILFGLLMAGTSLYFNIAQDNMKMTLFIVLGAAMVVLGAIKLKTKSL